MGKRGVRRIKGKLYWDTGSGYSAKAEAKYFAKKLREKGRQAIVVKLRYGYQIYARKPRKSKKRGR